MASIDILELSTSAYIADTTHLSLAEHGAYLLILMALRRAKGYLPDDDKVLANICKLSPTKWAKIAPVIRAFLISQGGKLTQKRLLSGVENDLKKISKASENGKLGGIAKSLKTNVTTVANATIPPAVRQPPQDATLLSSLEVEESQVSKKKKDSRGTRLPAEWEPTANHIEYGAAFGMTRETVIAHGQDMKLWADANSNRPIARKANWDATFKGWLRRASSRQLAPNRGGPPGGGNPWAQMLVEEYEGVRR